jgi:NRPS condensation-like uncharacterized protein
MKQIQIEPKEFWFPLDNAAKIFPATLTSERTAVFRLSVILNHRVQIQPLLKAATIAESRFPYFRVKIKKGFFWYYLEYDDVCFDVLPDDDLPCRQFSKDSLLTRIMVSQNQISVEFSHILTDGTGGFEFLKTLLLLYAEKCGVQIPDNHKFHRPGQHIKETEYEDAYNRYFKEEIPPVVKRSKSFHLPWPLRSVPRFRVKKLFISMPSVKSKATEKKVSITDYLSAVYIFILQQIYEETKGFRYAKKNKTIRLQVPVNLRNILPSDTMRNFSLFVMPEIDLRLGHYTFDEILKTVYHQIRLETDKKLIHKNISRNVSGEKKIYVRGIPLFLKSLILKMKYYSLGTSQYSGVITNMGKVKLPSELENMIDHFTFIPPPPNQLLKINCGIIGYGDTLVMSFGNITKSNELENRFIQFLKQEEITFEEEPAWQNSHSTYNYHTK